MATTIRDVAHRAGVSIATVSRALRDADSVTPETRARVTRAAAELEYVPSQLGRQLAQGRHAANGIVFPDLSGPYFAEVVLGYESVAAQLDRSVLILSTHGRRDAASLVTGLAARCDGIVVLGRTVDDDVVHGLTRRGTPDRADRPDPARRRRLGQRREPCLRPRCWASTWSPPVRAPSASSATPRPPRTRPSASTAVQAAAERGGAKVSVDPVADFSEEGGVHAARAALATRRTAMPDAFACANDELALGLMLGLRNAGVRVPDDTLISGWDDVMAARYAGLTTVRQPMRELGIRAAQLLDQLINRTREEPVHEVLATELIVRHSTTRSTNPAPPHPQEEPPDDTDPEIARRTTTARRPDDGRPRPDDDAGRLRA